MVEFKKLYPMETVPDPEPGFQVKYDLPEQESEVVELGGRPDNEELADQWMTVREAATALRVVPMTVYRMIKRGDLRTTRIGPRRIRVLKSDVIAMVNVPEEEK